MNDLSKTTAGIETIFSWAGELAKWASIYFQRPISVGFIYIIIVIIVVAVVALAACIFIKMKKVMEGAVPFVLCGALLVILVSSLIALSQWNKPYNDARESEVLVTQLMDEEYVKDCYLVSKELSHELGLRLQSKVNYYAWQIDDFEKDPLCKAGQWNLVISGRCLASETTLAVKFNFYIPTNPFAKHLLDKIMENGMLKASVDRVRHFEFQTDMANAMAKALKVAEALMAEQCRGDCQSTATTMKYAMDVLSNSKENEALYTYLVFRLTDDFYFAGLNREANEILDRAIEVYPTNNLLKMNRSYALFLQDKSEAAERELFGIVRDDKRFLEIAGNIRASYNIVVKARAMSEKRREISTEGGISQRRAASAGIMQDSEKDIMPGSHLWTDKIRQSKSSKKKENDAKK